MKSRTTDGPPKARSLIVPWTLGSSVPVEYVTFVPVAVAMHPVPPPTGRAKSISVPDAVAPPPPQFASDMRPDTAAELTFALHRSAAKATAHLNEKTFCTSVLLITLIGAI